MSMNSRYDGSRRRDSSAQLPETRLRAVLVVAVALLTVASAAAQDVALNPNHPKSYTVQQGDTLWDIAARFLREPWRWPDVWRANPDVRNPNRIYPGDVLTLSYENGQPRIRSQRTPRGMRVVKLSPRVRVTELDRAIPAIPVNELSPFLTRPVVTDSERIDEAPYVVGFPERHLLAGLGSQFYVRSILDADTARYDVLRPGQELRDPDTNEKLGYLATFVAGARLERTGDPATLVVIESQVEVETGDRVRPSRRDEGIRTFVPHRPPWGTQGKIIAVLGGVSQIGQYDVVVINRGEREGIEPGHVFEVFSGGTEERDEVRTRRAGWNWRNESPADYSFWYGDWEPTGWRRDWPDSNEPLPLHRRAERPSSTYIAPATMSGVLMIFRTFPKVSFGLVMAANRSMHVEETVATPRDL
jgi:LysM repeat protein